MIAFKAGDKAFVRVTVNGGRDEDGDYCVTTDDVRSYLLYVSAADLEPAPEPQRTDPELVPGMVVAPKDETDKRRWWVRPAVHGEYFLFAPDTAMPSGPRRELPAEIRVILDPREAGS